jgi:dihydrofolate synthase / folylpolyglutamate synthase
LITDAIARLFSLEHLGMKFGLENISRLCAALDHPERSFDSVIVAGTNGKGSVTAMVHHALVCAGHAAARYTSPHLERIEERYVIGRDEVSADRLEDAAERVLGAADSLVRAGSLDTLPTFFECATAIAFELFRQANVRVAVLEVGLGGRLDATNVVMPLAAAITSIAFDHQAQLGTTLESIAVEKAGVIKPGIPVVCGDLPSEAERVVLDVCRERGARCIPARDCVDITAILKNGTIALRGEHQLANARVAACLLRELDGMGMQVDADAIRAGLIGASWPGRLESFVHAGVEVLIDAAHNPAGAEALAAYLRQSGWTDAALVFAAMEDKDAARMLAALAPVCRALICTMPETRRAIPADALAAIAARLEGASWQISTVPDPATALAYAVRHFRRVVVAGSIFLIGPLRGILRR